MYYSDYFAQGPAMLSDTGTEQILDITGEFRDGAHYPENQASDHWEEPRTGVGSRRIDQCHPRMKIDHRREWTSGNAMFSRICSHEPATSLAHYLKAHFNSFGPVDGMGTH
jgi:hypothetical protein